MGVCRIEGKYMVNNVKVSVIIPIYNTEKYLNACLDSICNQTLTDIEIICINDGSTDSCGEILAQYEMRDDRIKIITQSNSGLSVARNKGLEVAKGEYIQFVDSDDRLVKNALEYASNVADKNNLDVFYFDAEVCFESIELKKKHSAYETYYNRSDKYNSIVSGEKLFTALINDDKYRMAAWLQFSKRSFLDNSNIKFIEGIVHEDNHFTTTIMLEAKRVLHENKKLYVRRVRDNSIMTSPQSFSNVYGYYKCVMELVKYLSSPHLLRESKVALETFIIVLLNNVGKIYSNLEINEQKNIERIEEKDKNILILIFILYRERLNIIDKFS